jgi:hypothetical protein
LSSKFLIYSIAFIACLGSNLPARADTLSILSINNIRIYTRPDLSRDTNTMAIPFSRAGNLIVVKAEADTIEGNFILDTGAPYLVLNITYFRDYPQRLVEQAEQTSMTGSSSTVAKTRIKTFSFGSLSFDALDADLANLGHIENSKGVKILGLLGMELFKQCEMIIDYERNLIYLHKISRKESATYMHELLKDTAAYRTFPIEITDNRIMVNTVMAGKKLKFVVDCAAESNVLSSKLPEKVFNNVEITGRVVLTGVNNRKVEALYGDLKHMKMGSYDLGTLPMLITNLENTCFSYAGCIDGILGFDFLSMHRVGFNFVKRKMYIWK